MSISLVGVVMKAHVLLTQGILMQQEAMNHHATNNKDRVPYDVEAAVISDSEGDDISFGEDEGEPVCLDLPSEVWAKVLDCEYKK